VLRAGFLLGLLGVGAGSAVSIAAGRLLWAAIPGFGQIALDTIGAVSLVVIVMATLAAWLPARAATKVDPLVALRSE
jgi:putative ABC transport system permease protein